MRLPVIGTLTAASPAKRLWVAGLALAAFLLALLVGNQTLDPTRGLSRRDLGHDFLAFHTAAAFVRDGRGRQLYDLDAVAAAERATAAANGISLGTDFGPWWNPPAYAVALAPLARLPYPVALDVWWAINGTAIAIAVLLLGRIARSGGASAWLVPLLVVISMPCVQAVSHGQNTGTSLLLLTVVVTLWRANRAVLAGLVAGLLFYKPQLAAVVATVLVIDLGWPAAAGLVLAGAALLLVTVVALPGSLGDWVHQLPANVRHMQVERPYLWDRHVTLKAFWRLLLQGKSTGDARPLTTALTGATVAAVAVGLGWAALRARRDAARRDRLIAATVCATPLLMPFYFDYDLLLLAVPLTLYAVDPARDRRLTGLWVALYAALFVAAPVAGATHVNLATVLLAAATTMSIGRVTRTAVNPGLTYEPVATSTHGQAGV